MKKDIISALSVVLNLVVIVLISYTLISYDTKKELIELKNEIIKLKQEIKLRPNYSIDIKEIQPEPKEHCEPWDSC